MAGKPRQRSKNSSIAMPRPPRYPASMDAMPRRGKDRGHAGRPVPCLRREFNRCCRRFATHRVRARGHGGGGNGDALAPAGLVDLRLDPNPGWPARPRPGGGTDAAHLAPDPGHEAPLAADDQAGAFAWNLAAGPVADLTAHISLSAGYRLPAPRGYVNTASNHQVTLIFL
jgi:hypothetical protein